MIRAGPTTGTAQLKSSSYLKGVQVGRTFARNAGTAQLTGCVSIGRQRARTSRVGTGR